MAKDARHFEHVDGTPFLWMADTIWSGARMSTLAEWAAYAEIRARQHFTVAQWSVSPGQDLDKETAFTGTNPITINPKFFKKLDARLDTLKRAGILSAVAPLVELDSQSESGAALPEDQALLLLRYVTSRWGADPVVWVLAFDGDAQGRKIGRWRRLGQETFADKDHVPVVLYPGATPWVLDEFRDQSWVDAFACQLVTDVSDDALTYAFHGPLSVIPIDDRARPMIAVGLTENAVGTQSRKRFDAEDVRRAAWWSLLQTTPAGLTYAAHGVENWDPTVQKGTDALPVWQKSLFMPGAKQMAPLQDFLNSIEYWRLVPRTNFVASQPGATSPRRQILTASTEAKDLAVAYIPQDRSVNILMSALPAAPAVEWFNPRTGHRSPAVAVVGSSDCQFPTPDSGDWLLVVKAGK